MINEYNAQQYCCDDISKIENYQQAVNDKSHLWHCHHRRESIYSRDGLKAIGEYYNRPACELIFLLHNEHTRLHFKNKKKSIEHNQKNSAAHMGQLNPFYGKTHTLEVREAISKANTGKHWFTNGKDNAFCFKCPEGYVKGKTQSGWRKA